MKYDFIYHSYAENSPHAEESPPPAPQKKKKKSPGLVTCNVAFRLGWCSPKALGDDYSRICDLLENGRQPSQNDKNLYWVGVTDVKLFFLFMTFPLLFKGGGGNGAWKGRRGELALLYCFYWLSVLRVFFFSEKDRKSVPVTELFILGLHGGHAYTLELHQDHPSDRILHETKCFNDP